MEVLSLDVSELEVDERYLSKIITRRENRQLLLTFSKIFKKNLTAIDERRLRKPWALIRRKTSIKPRRSRIFFAKKQSFFLICSSLQGQYVVSVTNNTRNTTRSPVTSALSTESAY